MTTNPWTWVVALATLGALACSDVTPPSTDPELAKRSPDQARKGLGPPQWASARVAHEVPAFGGAYIGGDGVMVITVTDRQAAGAAIGAVRRILAARGEGSRAVRIADVKHTLTELQQLHSQLLSVHQIRGVVASHVDERRNLVRIGLETEGARAAVAARLAELGIPMEVIRVEVEGPTTDNATLRDRVRPIQGGLRITGARGPLVTNCTEGPSVVYNNLPHFVVNSHCTQLGKGGLIGAELHQNLISVPNLAGFEVQDPPFLSGIPGCPEGAYCRGSDAALVRVAAGVSWDIGSVARTVERVVFPTLQGSVTIDASNPRIPIVGIASGLWDGDIVEKVGQETGWTAGPLLAVCQLRTTYNSDTDKTYGHFCSGVANYGSDPGDSGAPVLYRNASGDYYLVGIHYASVPVGGGPDSQASFSNWSKVDDELGAAGITDLEVVHPPITASVSGPTSVGTGTHTWTAAATGGSGTYSYLWEYSTDGETLIPFGSGASASRTLTSSDPDFSIRVTVSSPGWAGGNAYASMAVDNINWYPPLTGYFYGPSEVRGGDLCYWQAYASGGRPPYRYFWYWNSDLVGTSHVYARSFDPDDSNDGEEVGYIELILMDADDQTFFPDGMAVYRNDGGGQC